MILAVSVRISGPHWPPRGILADSIDQCLPSVMTGSQQQT
jgi:hypothetical protein